MMRMLKGREGCGNKLRKVTVFTGQLWASTIGHLYSSSIHTGCLVGGICLVLATEFEPETHHSPSSISEIDWNIFISVSAIGTMASTHLSLNGGRVDFTQFQNSTLHRDT